MDRRLPSGDHVRRSIRRHHQRFHRSRRLRQHLGDAGERQANRVLQVGGSQLVETAVLPSFD